MRRVPALVAWAALVGGILAGGAVAGIAFLGWKAADLEERARRAWRDASGLPAAAERAAPDESALALEADARRVGLELAPRGAARARPPRPPGVLAHVQPSLLAMITEGRLLHDVAPDLEGWWREHHADLDVLAAGMVARGAPTWESAAGGRIARVPPPGIRADRLLLEAARIEAEPEDVLVGEDERLARPGVPRLTSIVLLEQLLLVDALQHGRDDDRLGAVRSLTAAERLLEGLLGHPDAVTLGVAVHLSRLHAAALRQLPFDEWPRGFLDARLSELVPDALGNEARGLESGPSGAAGPGAFLAGPLRRVHAASSRTGIAAVRRRLLDAPCDLTSRSAWVAATESAPAWDRAGAAYLGDLADLARRAARADIERELTRRVVELRAGREPAAAGACPDRAFSVGGTPDAPRIRYEGPAPAIERAMPFELPLDASP